MCGIKGWTFYPLYQGKHPNNTLVDLFPHFVSFRTHSSPLLPPPPPTTGNTVSVYKRWVREIKQIRESFCQGHILSHCHTSHICCERSEGTSIHTRTLIKTGITLNFNYPSFKSFRRISSSRVNRKGLKKRDNGP